MIRKMIALDWRAMKVYHKSLPLLPFCAFICGMTSSLFVIPIFSMMCLSYSINPFFVEEKGDLNHLYLSLPVRRRDVVTGRYALSLVMLACGLLMGIAFTPLTNAISRSQWFIGLDGHLVVLSLSFLLYSIFNLFMFPLLFRLGYQKGKFWGFYLPLILFGVLFGAYVTISSLPSHLTFTIDFIVYASEHMLLVSGGMTALAVALLSTSYLVSLKLYASRDF